MPIQNLKSLVNTQTLKLCQYIRTNTKQNHLTLLTLHPRHFAFLSVKILKLNGHPGTLESTNHLDVSIKCASRWFIQAQWMQNLEFVNLKCVTYNTTHLGPLNQNRKLWVTSPIFSFNKLPKHFEHSNLLNFRMCNHHFSM